MSKDQVITLMKSSKSESEWNENCDTVKKLYKGYPDYWYKEIILSGLLNEVKTGWIN